MTSFMQVKIILDRLVGGEEIRMHGAFWRGKTRDEFVALNVMGLPIIAVGDPAGSNLVKALRGIPPFGRNLQPRPAGARFNRMPDRFPPATEAEIRLIEQWIAAGCPEGSLDPAVLAAGPLGPAAVDDALHVRFWREFDDFFLFKSSDETRQHVFGFIGDSVPVWQSFALQGGSVTPWTDHIAEPAVRENIDYILRHHLQLLGLLYGTPLPVTKIFDSYWRFGGNLLPDDPDSSGPVRHTMNSPGDWFNWSPFLDAILRIGANADTLLLARGWHIGLVADGLLRVDADRPPDDRLKIPDFQANDPKLFQSVVARYGQADSVDLLAEFVRRARETSALQP